MDQAIRDYLIKLENPYAKLSVRGAWEEAPIWAKPRDFLDFLGECFSTVQFGSKAPAVFQNLAAITSKLSHDAQEYVKGRMASLVPPVPLAFNRLGPDNLKALAAKIQTILEEAKALDGPAE